MTTGTIIHLNEVRARRQAAQATQATPAAWVPLERAAAEAYQDHFRHQGALDAMATLHRDLESGLIPALASAQSLARRDDLSEEAEALVACLLDCLGHVADRVRDLGEDEHTRDFTRPAELMPLRPRNRPSDPTTEGVG